MNAASHMVSLPLLSHTVCRPPLESSEATTLSRTHLKGRRIFTFFRIVKNNFSRNIAEKLAYFELEFLKSSQSPNRTDIIL